jgi:hypothetical protein
VIVGIPLRPAVWVYLTLQLGFDRLGRGHLNPARYRGDRSLGLRPVGRLAFTGFWMLVGSVGPLVLTNASDTASSSTGCDRCAGCTLIGPRRP